MEHLQFKKTKTNTIGFTMIPNEPHLDLNNILASKVPLYSV